jgi:hypothetical protein
VCVCCVGGFDVGDVTVVMERLWLMRFGELFLVTVMLMICGH